jgi:uncharacterized protein with HEPN domain
MIDAAEQARHLAVRGKRNRAATGPAAPDALLWNFTVLGEAAARLSGDTQARFPDVQWQQPARLRNRVVHGYWSIDVEILHNTATEQLPQFISDLRAVLAVLAAEHGDSGP